MLIITTPCQILKLSKVTTASVLRSLTSQVFYPETYSGRSANVVLMIGEKTFCTRVRDYTD